MYYSIKSGILSGLCAVEVNVEVDIAKGLPNFDMTGTLSLQVREAGDRVRVAIKNSGWSISNGKVLVNIAPADVRKSTTALDLPIALGILGTCGIINNSMTADTFVAGELCLSGDVKSVSGLLNLVHALLKSYKRFIIPYDNLADLILLKPYIGDTQIIGVKNLEECVGILSGRKHDNINTLDMIDVPAGEITPPDVFFPYGQELAKRATAIACSGHHNIIYIGAPGVGKSLLARSIPALLPDMDNEELIEIAGIYNAAGEELYMNKTHERPFRTPDTKITPRALLGGGRYPVPGEVSLAHNGVLFMDELNLFPANILNSLKLPLENKEITIGRVDKTYTFPANFMLAGTLNPCPCGFYPDRTRCSCTERDINRYLHHIDHSFYDRIDMIIEMARPDIKEYSQNKEELALLKTKIKKAKEIQTLRFKNESFNYNSNIPDSLLDRYCTLTDSASKILKRSYEKMNLSMRAYNRILKVGRTVADLDGDDNIREEHILEVINYRNEMIL